jgi:sigma-54 specific flagellar transcriptional regulator A
LGYKKMLTTVEKICEIGEANDLIVGRSAYIAELKAMIARVAASEMPVLISGPSGAGKELVARAIHLASQRNKAPLVAINCGAIPPDLIESELFGHERGSFTGATARRIGRFEEADGGTLFLDEIGDMRFDMQVKLLRVLEEKLVSRIGGGHPVPVNVRIISATHQNLRASIDKKRFREDLYFRLGVIPIRVPSLSERADDIPLLIRHFQRKAGRRTSERFTTSALDAMMQHDWPGNVRELRNVIERAAVMYTGEEIDGRKVERLIGKDHADTAEFNSRKAAAAIEAPIGHTGSLADQPAVITPPNCDKLPINLKELLETMELERIHNALDLADGVISEAARLLTLKRTTLIEKIRKYGIDRVC